MGLTTAIHYVKNIEIKPIDSSKGTYWRKILVSFQTHEGETMVFELCMYGKPEDLKIRIPAPISAEVEI